MYTTYLHLISQVRFFKKMWYVNSVLIFFFQIRDNMFIAPMLRNSLTSENKKTLDEYMRGKYTENEITYVKLLKNKSYMPKSSVRTLPVMQKSKKDEDFCEIIGK